MGRYQWLVGALVALVLTVTLLTFDKAALHWYATTDEGERLGAESVVVQRSAEVFTTPAGWLPVDRAAWTLSEVGGAYLMRVAGANPSIDLAARFRLIVLSAGTTYEVLVSAACFETVGLGDAWPTGTPECS